MNKTGSERRKNEAHSTSHDAVVLLARTTLLGLFSRREFFATRSISFHYPRRSKLYNWIHLQSKIQQNTVLYLVKSIRCCMYRISCLCEQTLHILM